MDTNMNTAPLGSIENPHPYKWGQKDRIKGHCYLNKSGELRYWNGKRLKNGNNSKEYYENNKEKIKKNNKKYRENNKEYYKEYNKEWRENNPEYDKEYRENNKERINECKKERYRTDPIFRLTCTVKPRVLAALKSQGASKNHRTMEYVGCSVALLYYHLEAQFEPWMTWDNLGVYDPDGPRTWQIDHRRPCDSFDLNDEDQQFMCFNWTNLQPLCSKENVVDKNNNFDPETFQYKWMGREIGWVGIPSYLMGK